MKDNACTKLSVFVQTAIELLKEAQKELEASDAIRGGTFAISAQAMLDSVANQCNILAPLQMMIIPNGKGHVDKAIDDSKIIIDSFLTLHKSTVDEEKSN